MVSLEFSGLKNFIDETEFRVVAPETERALALLKNGQGAARNLPVLSPCRRTMTKKNFCASKKPRRSSASKAMS